MVAILAKNPLMTGYSSSTDSSDGFLGKGTGGRESGGKRKKSGGAGRVAKGVVSGAITLAGAYGDVTTTPQSGSAPLRDEAKTITNGERTTRERASNPSLGGHGRRRLSPRAAASA
jgi:hypothetical protein